MIIMNASCSNDDGDILRSLLFLRMVKFDAGPVTQKMSEVTRWVRDNAGHPTWPIGHTQGELEGGKNYLWHKNYVFDLT